MKHDDKSGKVAASLEKIAHYNMFLAEALFELLAEKGVVNGVEVKERVRKLMAETKLQIPPVQ